MSDAAEIGADASLELPGELLNKSFQTVTNISKAISRLMLVSAWLQRAPGESNEFQFLLQNSARRYSRFVLFFKPVFGDALVVKGSEDPTTTTTTPRTTSTTTEADKVNEI